MSFEDGLAEYYCKKTLEKFLWKKRDEEQVNE